MGVREVLGKEVDLDKELVLIAEKLQAVKESGFGEVRILVKNGAIYRILTTEDELMESKDK